MTKQQIEEFGFTYYPDSSHAGEIQTTAAVVAEYGVEHLFYQRPLEEFNDVYGWDEEDRLEYPEEYESDLESFKSEWLCYISHCFLVEDPEGHPVPYGGETPHGTVGSMEFTCWWNGIPHEMLKKCNINSWCDG